MSESPRAAILGFGNQGAAQAHCLRASGWSVIVGARPGRGAERARAAGFPVRSIAEAAAEAEFVALLLPDEAIPALYRSDVRPALPPGAVLVFAHGFSILYGGLEWPAGADAVLVSPTAPGRVLAEEFDAGRGVPAYLAVAADGSGRAWQRAEVYARGLGCDRARMLRSTVREETVLDLFGEQTVLVGGMLDLVSRAVSVLVEAGHSPAVAYLECAHQLKFLADLLHRAGPEGFVDGISRTALFGALTRGPRVLGPEGDRRLRELLEEIESGAFAREFLEDQRRGGARLAAELGRARGGALGGLTAAREVALGPAPDPSPSS